MSFRGVRFRYPTRPEAPILQGLDLTIDAGKTLALVGPSGCGKSTTIQLLERYYDPEVGNVVGKIHRLGDIFSSCHCICIIIITNIDTRAVVEIRLSAPLQLLDGRDIRHSQVRSLRNHISLVAQEPSLFDATVRENIAYGDLSRDITMEEIIEASKMANIHDFVKELPQVTTQSSKLRMNIKKASNINILSEILWIFCNVCFNFTLHLNSFGGHSICHDIRWMSK